MERRSRSGHSFCTAASSCPQLAEESRSREKDVQRQIVSVTPATGSKRARGREREENSGLFRNLHPEIVPGRRWEPRSPSSEEEVERERKERTEFGRKEGKEEIAGLLGREVNESIRLLQWANEFQRDTCCFCLLELRIFELCVSACGILGFNLWQSVRGRRGKRMEPRCAGSRRSTVT